MSDDIEVPTGPFVSYGRLVGTIVAPGTSVARAFSIGFRITAVHILLAVAWLWWVPATVPASPAVAVVVGAIGFIAGGRYAENCAARHEQLMNQLEEEFEGDVHEV